MTISSRSNPKHVCLNI